MIKYLYRHNKDYSRFNIIKQLTRNINIKNDVYILLPFSKNQFFKHFFKRHKIINDFFISNYDTYVNDRQKISNKNPRAWWKYFQDWFNFRFSKYILSDTNEHFKYWEKLFGEFSGKHFVLPVLADKDIYFPLEIEVSNKIPEILFYGSFIPLHGIDIILYAFRILEDENLEFKAKIIGNGQMYRTMKQLFDSLELKNVQMDGVIIGEKELSDEIRRTDIVLGIFGDSKKAKSVVPNKAYQALACQKTLVTMDSVAVREFFNDHDLIFCKNKSSSLADALKSLILNPDKLEKYKVNGHNKFLELYDQKKEEFIDFIQKIDNETTK